MEALISGIYILLSCCNEKIFHILGNFLDQIVVKPNVKHLFCGKFNVNFYHKEKNQTTNVHLANKWINTGKT